MLEHYDTLWLVVAFQELWNVDEHLLESLAHLCQCIMGFLGKSWTYKSALCLAWKIIVQTKVTAKTLKVFEFSFLEIIIPLLDVVRRFLGFSLLGCLAAADN